jgi:hypothetical protein
MKDIEFRLNKIVELREELGTTSFRKSTLLLILTQAEGLVRQVKQELGYNKPEPTYQPVEPKRLEKYQFKKDNREPLVKNLLVEFQPVTCCGKTFYTKQAYSGHLNSKIHRKK